MAMFIVLRLIDGTFKYKKIFGCRIYKKFQEETDAILIAEGREDLIEEV
ncbi:MAG: hypothetical protein MR285_06270 [Peptoniphilus sp.]|nr:hypothetical protein [Peptoniphilus sp.]MCI5643694.1 hypothetical protein [Peptoniphilus sp.]